ncbi:hypothetical protein [Segatella buccae]|uniref:hypothetical protein n=1 Tax=Segatella buccae TaxID=28126 RepID=UPI00248E5B64|nr:hypothetical protein [Segatella buccae]
MTAYFRMEKPLLGGWGLVDKKKEEHQNAPLANAKIYRKTAKCKSATKNIDNLPTLSPTEQIFRYLLKCESPPLRAQCHSFSRLLKSYTFRQTFYGINRHKKKYFTKYFQKKTTKHLVVSFKSDTFAIAFKKQGRLAQLV